MWQTKFNQKIVKDAGFLGSPSKPKLDSLARIEHMDDDTLVDIPIQDILQVNQCLLKNKLIR